MSDRLKKSKHPLYRRHISMLDRCLNPESPNYKRYGGRGISVCDRWVRDFWAFVEDVGMPDDLSLHLDRINNSRGYAKENIRWVSSAENNRNRRDNKRVGEVCFAEFSRRSKSHTSKTSRDMRRGYCTYPKGSKHSFGRCKELKTCEGEVFASMAVAIRLLGSHTKAIYRSIREGKAILDKRTGKKVTLKYKE